MSLNQGDIITSGPKGSAVLQFANGSSEDDQMTLGADTSMTFAKVSDKKGTVTKVSVLKGNVWSHVKSIKSAEDAFQLETPTASMGVRGTNFAVVVDPKTGTTTLLVLSGIVQTGLPSAPATVPVYPTQQIQLNPSDRQPEAKIAFADLNAFVQSASSELVQAIIKQAPEINQENEAFIQRLQNGNGLLQPTSSFQIPSDLSPVQQNLEQLVGNLAQKAIEQNKSISSDIQKAIDEANSKMTDLMKKLDLGNVKPLDPAAGTDPSQSASAKNAQAEYEAQLKEEQMKQMQELQKKMLDMLKKIQEEKTRLTQQNRNRQMVLDQQALDAYLKGMTDAERQAFEQNRAALGLPPVATPAPTPTPVSPGGSGGSGGSPTPTPAPTATPTPTASPSPTPSATPTTSPSPTPAPFYGVKYADAKGEPLQLAFAPDQHVYEMKVSANNADLTITGNISADLPIKKIWSNDISYTPNADGEFRIPLRSGSEADNVISIWTSDEEPGNDESVSTLYVERADTPEGIISWSAMDQDEHWFDWYNIASNKYAAGTRSTDTERLALQIQVEENVESIHVGVDGVGADLSRFDGEDYRIFFGEIFDSLAANQATSFTLTLKDAEGRMIGQPQQMFWMNGIPESLLFELRDGSGTPARVNLEDAEEMNFSADVSPATEEIVFAPNEMGLVPLSVLANGENTYLPSTDGLIRIPLMEGPDQVLFADMGPFVIRIHLYKDLPDGLNAFQVKDPNGDRLVWNKKPVEGEQPVYRALLYSLEFESSIEFEVNSGQEVELYISGEKRYTFNSVYPTFTFPVSELKRVEEGPFTSYEFDLTIQGVLNRFIITIESLS
nr:FecR domain-containing protein [Cohnella sp. REN36]